MTRSDIVRRYLDVLQLEPGPPTPGFLREITQRHLATFPFSSLGCQLGEELPLDVESLYDRIVVRRRGGYCFEQNGLMFEILHELGFAPTLYLARVIHNRYTHPGLTHRLSMVDVADGRCLVDVGFGNDCPRVPVPMNGQETCDGLQTYRVHERTPGEYHLQVVKEDGFFSLYRFELARYGPSDCEVGHFYSHRHPDAIFVNHLAVAIKTAERTVSLRDLEVWTIRAGEIEIAALRTSRELAGVLTEVFRLRVTDEEGERLFRKLTAAGREPVTG